MKHHFQKLTAGLVAGALSLCAVLTTPATPNVAHADEFNFEQVTINGMHFTLAYDLYAILETCDADVTSLTIPTAIKGLPVTTIGFMCFEGCTQLSSVSIPDSVTDVNPEAFVGTALVENADPGPVYAGSWIVAWKEGGPADVVVKDGTVGIACNASCSVEDVQSITLPDSIRYINFMGFSNMTNLEQINLPDSVVNIGGMAFDSTKVLSDSESNMCCLGDWLVGVKNVYLPPEEGGLSGDVRIPDTVKHIADTAFEGASVDSIILPEELETIGSGTFDYMTTKQINIPATLRSIGNFAFQYATLPAELTLPATLTDLGYGAFYEAQELKKVTILNPDCEFAPKLVSEYEDITVFPSSVEIVGYKGSTAEAYAKANGNKFTALSDTPAPTTSPTSTTTTSTTTSTTTTNTTTTTTDTTILETHAPVPATLAGDVNCDGKLNVADAVLMARAAANDTTLVMTAAGALNADYNADGIITAEDLMLFLKKLAKKA